MVSEEAPEWLLRLRLNNELDQAVAKGLRDAFLGRVQSSVSLAVVTAEMVAVSGPLEMPEPYPLRESLTEPALEFVSA